MTKDEEQIKKEFREGVHGLGCLIMGIVVIFLLLEIGGWIVNLIRHTP
jgi:hypothetical protein